MEMTNVLWWIKLASVFLMKSSQLDGGKFYFMIVPANDKILLIDTPACLFFCVVCINHENMPRHV